MPGGSAPATLPYSARIEEATRLTGVSKTRLYELLAESRVKGNKCGRSTLVLMDGVRAYVDDLPNLRREAMEKRP